MNQTWCVFNQCAKFIRWLLIHKKTRELTFPHTHSQLLILRAPYVSIEREISKWNWQDDRLALEIIHTKNFFTFIQVYLFMHSELIKSLSLAQSLTMNVLRDHRLGRSNLLFMHVIFIFAVNRQHEVYW